MNLVLLIFASLGAWLARSSVARSDRALGPIMVVGLGLKVAAGAALAATLLAAINGAFCLAIGMIAVRSSWIYPLVMAGATLDAAVIAALGLYAEPASIAALDSAASAVAVVALWSSLPIGQKLAKAARHRTSFSAQTGLPPPD